MAIASKFLFVVKVMKLLPPQRESFVLYEELTAVVVHDLPICWLVMIVDKTVGIKWMCAILVLRGIVLLIHFGLAGTKKMMNVTLGVCVDVAIMILAYLFLFLCLNTHS